MMKVVVDGVTFTQMDNGHIWMEKDGKIISHASRSGYMNENQLKEYGKLKNRLHRLLQIDDELLDRASKVQEAHMAAVEDWQDEDKNYYELIEKIVEHKNGILDTQKEIDGCSDSDERARLEAYITEGYGLIDDIYHMLIDKGYTRDEIDFDVAHT